MPITRRWQVLALAGGLAALYAARKLTRPATVQAPGRGATAPAPHIVILGGGFAGAYAARELARLLPRATDARITLVAETNFLLFTPMLTEIVSGEVDLHDIVSPLRQLTPRVTFLQGRVDQIDLRDRTASITVGATLPGIPATTRTLHADQLVIALGAVPDFHGIPGLERHALTIKRVSEAEAIHERTLALLERADAEPDPAVRRALLTFVVGGGGFSGVETIAALNDFVRAVGRHYPHIAPDEISTILVHPEDRLLPELSPDLAAYAQRELERRGVRVILQTGVAGAGPDFVDLDGEPRRIRAHTLIWTAGVTPSPVVRHLDCQHGRHHGIVVDACFRVPEHPGVWALGDCAEVPRPDSGAPYAPTGQNATREGARLARNLAAALHGAEPRPFTYHPIGAMALVGRHAGIASIYGLHFSGVLAWMLWRAVYLAEEPRMAKRVRTAVNWTLDLVGTRALAQIPNPPTVPRTGPQTAPAQPPSAADTAAPAAR